MGRTSGSDNSVKDQSKIPEFNYSDPYVENSFGVDLAYNGNKIATFTSVSGGALETAVISYTLNGADLTKLAGGSGGIMMPGACGFEPIILSYGVTDDMRFWEWWTDMTAGKVYRRVNLSLIAYGLLPKKADGTYDAKRRTAKWNLTNAWPSRISGFNFDLDSTSAFIAEVTLIVESITRVNPS
ncbi:MAG: hypothetical protein FOGNACKC_04716 [Anaerolineae bacterium]|nr:hypothetical protein [Anaerolineae bacterium]